MANDAFLDALAIEIVSKAEDQARLDALTIEIVSKAEPQARLDALAIEIVSKATAQSRLDDFVIEVVWTGTGVLIQSIGAGQVDLSSGTFEASGEDSRQLTMSDDAVTANKIGFLWRTVEVEASAFTYDGVSTSYHTLTAGPRTTNAPTSELPQLSRNGVADQTLVTTPGNANEWGLTGSNLSVFGDVTSSGDVYEVTYLTHSSLKGGILLRADTTDDTPTVMTTDGNAAVLGNTLTLADDSTLLCRVYIVARRTDTDGESAAYILEALFARNSGVATTALVGSVRTVFEAEDSPAWAAILTANITLGGVQVQVTGENLKNITWRAFALLQPVQG